MLVLVVARGPGRTCGDAQSVAVDGSTSLVAETGQSWDAVLLVRYPSRDAFTRMVADPEYQEVTDLRSRALTEAVLRATMPWA
jgi:uncharacterized protein (DUF1330 family)